MNTDGKPYVPKTALDIQKLKLAKLMENPNKPVIIPDTPREKKAHNVPEFVRNVMGSSAGAGSGEFHVYRHLRRKEYARQKMIEETSLREQLDKTYAQKREENEKKMQEKTAKKRAKRLKRKQKLKMLKKNPVQKEIKAEESDSDDSSIEEEEQKVDKLDDGEICEDKDTSHQSGNDEQPFQDETIKKETKAEESDSEDSSIEEEEQKVDKLDECHTSKLEASQKDTSSSDSQEDT